MLSSTAKKQPSPIGNRKITALSSDVIQSQILTRLDGASLAALSCTCSQLNSYCSENFLWREKCSATWPSTLDPRVQTIISTFPAGHRSFFSDSFPFVADSGEIDRSPSVDTTEMISAVDVRYKDEVIFSKVQVTETNSGWFLYSPMRIDLVEPKELISTRVSAIHQWEGDTWKEDLEENLSLSWILIDPTSKRAADISTRKPVFVHRHWLTGEVHVRFSTIFAVREEKVEFTVTVVLAAISRREEEKAAMQIREVSLVVEDMEGMNLGGRGTLVILTSAMGMNRRRRAGREEEGKEKYKEFVSMKTEKAEMKWRRKEETAMETTACLVAVIVLGFLLCFCLIIHKNIICIMKKMLN
ncbi:unnamed protein product [Cochlearia groenlandica]